MILAQFGDQAFGRIALAVVFRRAIVLDDRLGHQRNDFAPVGVNERGTQQVMGIGDGAVSVVALSTRLAVNLPGGKIARTIEGQEIMPLDKHHVLKGFAALKRPKDMREQRPQ